MKIRNYTALLIALLSVSLLAGCFARAAETRLERAGEVMEHKPEIVEEAAEKAILPAQTAPADMAPLKPLETVPAVTEAGTYLTVEEAKAIALSHAGFTEEQVKFLRAEFEIDDRIPQFDIEFREGYWEYDYEIHGETGAILSFDKDD